MVHHDAVRDVDDPEPLGGRRGGPPDRAERGHHAVEQRQRYLELGPELANMNHLIHMLRHRRFWSKDPDDKATDPTIVFYEREIARGIAQAMTGKPEEGKATLTALSRRLEKLLRNKGRVIYLSVCVAAALAVALLASVALASSISIDRNQLALAIIMGAVGALLSTATGLRRLKIDASSTPSMNWIYGGQRMLVGVLGAVVVYLALRAGVATDLLPGVGATETLDPYKLAFVSVLAGFSERMVPNLLDREQNGDRQGETDPAKQSSPA